jgi:hypothetical protein
VWDSLLALLVLFTGDEWQAVMREVFAYLIFISKNQEIV